MNGTVEECPRCAVCGEPAGQQCGGCRAEHYCNRAHQKQAWRNGHRLRCTTFRMEEDPVLGRRLVATRDIKQGETILKEKAAIVGPKMLCYPTCLSCYKRVHASRQTDGTTDYYKCTSCNWPMCDAKCQDSKIHKEECELMTIRKYKSTISFSGGDKKESAYCVITPLRILLMKKSDPKQHEAIMSLESHIEDRINTPLYRILKANMVTFMQQVLGLSTICEETILRTAGILDTNAFDIRNNEIQRKARGVYLTATLLAHDCNPNTKHVYVDDSYCTAIIATVPISKGTVLTTSYTQPLWGTLARRSHLQTVKCFTCSCDRCKDPTEFGTYLGSINCSKCNPLKDSPKLSALPKMLSIDPLNNAAEWKCERCNHKIPARQMTWGNDAIRKEIQSLGTTHPKPFEEFLEKYKQALHPTNYHILEVKYTLAQMYGNLPGFTFIGKYIKFTDFFVYIGYIPMATYNYS